MWIDSLVCASHEAMTAYSRFENRVAIPRKLKKPVTSVTVVRRIDEDWAGSWPIAVRKSGIAAPNIPAIAMERIMDTPITPASPTDPLQTQTPSAVVSAMAMPFQKPVDVSLKMTRGYCRARISRRASPRMVTARACAPVFPDWPATTGNSTARAV